MNLRPYQADALAAAQEFLRGSISPCLIEAATGAGKSHIIAELAKWLRTISGGKRVLCLAPRAELVKQNLAKYLATGEAASMFSASAGAKSTRHPVVFGTPGTVTRAISRFCQQGVNGFCAVIVDECFTADTMIDTPRGRVPINSLRTGDIVCNAVGSGQVETIFTKAVHELCEIGLSDGTRIKCTPSHPFFTGRGWVAAEELLEGEVTFRPQDLSSLLKAIRTKTVHAQGEEGHISMLGIALEQASNLLAILRKEVEEPDALCGVAWENAIKASGDWAQAKSSLGQWQWSDGPATKTAQSFGRGLDCGTPYSDRDGAQERDLPKLIQSGLGMSNYDDRSGGGRREPRDTGASSGGQKEGCATSATRVESVSRIKCESPEIVFNLHVSGHPSYFAGGVLVHNCHGITPTIRGIIDAMREANPNLRVVGLTATPYSLGSGYIFTMWPDGRANGDDVAREPYFSHCVYRVDARDLIRHGFLTPPVIGKINEAYDTGGLVLLPNGKFDAATVDAAFVGHGRKTAAIVADVVSQAAARKGVVFFAATVRHAEEIIASLPPGLSALITGETDNRERILKRFDNREIKYLVNVGVLTTGWDAPHVDLIAILRRTESVSLLQQIIGRGLRLYEGKVDCLVLDYADNLETHCPDGDLFAPVIKAGKASGGGEPIEAHCPDCGHVNEFTLNGEYANYQRDKHGYCLDVFGEQIKTEFGPLAAHYGRRCFGLVQSGPAGQHDRCGYRWTGKDCPACGEKNDIAARYCYVCRAEIVNPNDKLVAEFKALKRDPTRPQTDAVISVKFIDGISRAGAKTVRADWVTPYRQFSTWFMPQATHTKAMRDWAAFSEVTGGATVAPQTITYQKEESGFFRIMAYNRPADEEPLKDRAA